MKRRVGGGKDQFKWDDVIKDQQRGNYLGSSLAISQHKSFGNPNPRALDFYLHDKTGTVDRTEIEDEVARLKYEEETMMAKLLGLPPLLPPSSSKTTHNHDVREGEQRSDEKRYGDEEKRKRKDKERSHDKHKKRSKDKERHSKDKERHSKDKELRSKERNRDSKDEELRSKDSKEYSKEKSDNHVTNHSDRSESRYSDYLVDRDTERSSKKRTRDEEEDIYPSKRHKN